MAAYCLEGFTVPSDDDKYVTKHIGIDFLNKSENKNVDEKTYNKLVKKIKDYIRKEKPIGVSLEQEKLNLPQIYGAEANNKEKVKKQNNNNGAFLQRKQDAKIKIMEYKNRQRNKDNKTKVALAKLKRGDRT